MQVSYSCLVPNQTKKKDKKIQFFPKDCPIDQWPENSQNTKNKVANVFYYRVDYKT